MGGTPGTGLYINGYREHLPPPETFDPVDPLGYIYEGENLNVRESADDFSCLLLALIDNPPPGFRQEVIKRTKILEKYSSEAKDNTQNFFSQYLSDLEYNPSQFSYPTEKIQSAYQNFERDYYDYHYRTENIGQGDSTRAVFFYNQYKSEDDFRQMVDATFHIPGYAREHAILTIADDHGEVDDVGQFSKTDIGIYALELAYAETETTAEEVAVIETRFASAIENRRHKIEDIQDNIRSQRSNIKVLKRQIDHLGFDRAKNMEKIRQHHASISILEQKIADLERDIDQLNSAQRAAIAERQTVHDHRLAFYGALADASFDNYTANLQPPPKGLNRFTDMVKNSWGFDEKAIDPDEYVRILLTRTNEVHLTRHPDDLPHSCECDPVPLIDAYKASLAYRLPNPR